MRDRLEPGARVCIVMMSALGDAVHVLPVVTALKRHDRTVRVTWVLQPGPAELVRGHPDVDEIVVFRREAGVAGWREVRRALAERRFDVVLDLQVYLKASLVTAMARAPVKLGFDRKRARDLNWLVTNRRIAARPPGHVQDQYFEFLEALGVAAEPVEWKLGPWEWEREAQRGYLERFDRPVAALAIGASDRRKMWVPEKWARVAEALYEREGVQPVVVRSGAAHEVREEAEVRAACRVPLPTTEGGPLRELVWLLDGAALVIGLNSAPMHIAVAVGTPVVSLLGHVNPLRTGPYRRFHDLMIDVYGEPGERYGPSLEKRRSRMGEIEPAQVLEKVRVWRERYAAGGADG